MNGVGIYKDPSEGGEVARVSASLINYDKFVNTDEMDSCDNDSLLCVV